MVTIFNEIPYVGLSTLMEIHSHKSRTADLQYFVDNIYPTLTVSFSLHSSFSKETA